MSEPRRYVVPTEQLADRSVVGDKVFEGATDVVTLADHVAAVAELEKTHAAALEDEYRRWRKAAEDVLKSWPRTLTADDPEPAIDSVVLDRGDQAWQRVQYEDQSAWVLAHAPLEVDDPEPSRQWPISTDSPVTLIHDGAVSAAAPQGSPWAMRPGESPSEWLARNESPEAKAAWEKFCDDYEAGKRGAPTGSLSAAAPQDEPPTLTVGQRVRPWGLGNSVWRVIETPLNLVWIVDEEGGRSYWKPNELVAVDEDDAAAPRDGERWLCTGP